VKPGYIWAYVLLFMLVFSSMIQFTTVFSQGSYWSIEGYSFKSRSGGDVYPGSSGATLTVDLRYTGLQDAVSPYACLTLPEGFTTRGSGCSSATYPNGTYIHKAAAGDIVRFTYTVDVSRNTAPGTYVFTLNITFYTNNVLEYQVISIPVNVSEYPPLVVSVEKAYFTPYSYPGSNPVSLYVKISNQGNTTITSLDLTLHLPKEYFTPSEVNTTYTGSISAGESASIVFNNILIKPYTPPGTYTALLKATATLTTSDGVSYSDNTELVLGIQVDQSPGVDLRILDYSLTAQYPLPGLNNTGIRLVIQSLEPGVVRLNYLKVSLVNAETGNGSSTLLQVVGTTVSYMDTAQLAVNGLTISDGVDAVEAYMELECMVNRDQSWYPAVFTIKLAIPLRTPTGFNIRVDRASWSNGAAYPGSTGLSLVVALLNNEGFSIRDADAILELPGVFRPVELTSRNIVVNQHSITEITFTGIDVAKDATPGLYDARMTLKGYLVNNDGSVRYVELVFPVYLRVSSIEELSEWKPVLALVDYYWGDGAPAYTYTGNPRAALTIEVANTGIYQVSNIMLELLAPSDVVPLTNTSTCGAVLSPGATCQAVFYLNLSNSQPGLKNFTVIARYVVNALNTGPYFNESLGLSIFLPSYGAGEGIAIASSQWANNNPVYPGEKGAVYSVTLANLEPYPVYSIWVTIKPPSCIMLHEGVNESTYIPGPVNSLQSVSVSYVLDNACNKPGAYTGFLEVNYYVQYAGGGYRKSTTIPISFTISDPASAVEVVKAGWSSGAPVKGGRGVEYTIILRNLELPSISNPILVVNLPSGFTDASTGLQRAVATPITVIPSQQLQSILQNPSLDISSLMQAIQAVQGQAGSPANVQRGDLMVFTLRLNIGDEPPGVYMAGFTLAFTDHWGYPYSVNGSLSIQLQYQPPLLSVKPVSPVIYFTNGSSMLEVEVSNEYDAPVYNVYIALIPASNNAIPQGAVKYIDVIPGNSSIRLRYEMVYNPISISIGGGVSASPSSAVFTVTLLYRDEYGYLRTLNTTLSAVIRPFINLELTPDTNARYLSGGGKLVVNGVILNTGLAQARSVYVRVIYGDSAGYTFIGDIDPSSQTPFRIEVYYGRYLDNCTVVVEFKDEYNTYYTLQYTLPVQLLEQQTTTPAAPSSGSEYYIVVIALVAVFLAGVFYLLYRYTSKHRAVAG